MSKSTPVVAALAAAAIAAPYVEKWEGWENKAYRDMVNVWTACAGETRGIQPGAVYSDPQCRTMMARSLIDHALGIAPCLPETLPDKTRGAFVVTAYNIGVAGFCGSSMSRKAKAGDLAGACASLDLWNKAGGSPVRGLILRRSDERNLCESGLA